MEFAMSDKSKIKFTLKALDWDDLPEAEQARILKERERRFAEKG